ncbi:MAG: hypothetical protein ACOYN4_09910 [Bacteroidales bacterium]
MKLVYQILVFSLLILAISCKKSPEIDLRLIPKFVGEVNTEVNIKTIHFSATFERLDPKNAEDCGFEWGEKGGSVFENISIGKISDYGFSAQPKSTLEENGDYEVRAWVIVGGKKFYSPTTIFKGFIISKPAIISLDRSHALWGDTLKMKLSNLTADIIREDIRVKIDNIETAVESVVADEISVIMPFTRTAGNLNINISINGKPIANSAEVENAYPVVAEISPQLVHFEDNITIKGNFWAEYSGRVIPIMSQVTPFMIESYNNGEIVIKAPRELSCYSKYVIDFKILKTTDAVDAESCITGLSVDRIGHWESMGYASPLSRVKTVMLYNVAYTLESKYSTSPFWKFNPSTSQWIKLANYPAVVLGNQTLVVCNGEIYSGFWHLLNQDNNFFKYNVTNNTWVPCAKMPPQNTSEIFTSVTIQDKIYTFLSLADKKCIYDPILDSWDFSPCEVPDFIGSAKVFVYNGEYYFYKSENGDAIYKYDVSTNSFIAVFFNGLGALTGPFFTVDGRYYCAHRCQVYEFVWAAGQMVELPGLANYKLYDYQFGNDSFLFEFNKKAFFLYQSQSMMSFVND